MRINPLNLNRLIPAEEQVYHGIARARRLRATRRLEGYVYRIKQLSAAIGSYLCLALPTHAASVDLEEVVVTATLQSSDAVRLSTRVLDASLIEQRSAQHLEDVLSAAPNVNAAAGASRSRFFQIRGIGERSQFVEPLNASVAMLLDGIDLTGLGGAATTWDLAQVEILKGPQGSLLGANALAGLIHLSSQAPRADAELGLELGLENYGGRKVGAIAGGSLTNSVNGRLAVQRYANDGYLRNAFLQRDDVNARDEVTAKGLLQYVGASSTVDVGLYYIDVDNGYDAFSLDNTRTTLSDQPGKDALETRAARLRWQQQGTLDYSVQLSTATTDSIYSYDEDWSFVGIAPDQEYSSFDRYQRSRDMHSLDARAHSDSDFLTWTVGSYLRTETEDLERDYTYLAANFLSSLDIDTAALFAQASSELTTELRAFAGLRFERRASDYRDSNGVDSSFSDNLWSGRTGLEWQANEHNVGIVSLSRGVRGGGVNASLLASINALPDDVGPGLQPLGQYDAESLLNAEITWRYQHTELALRSDVTVFSMWRRDQQVRQSLTVPRADGSTAFLDYSDNAARGTNRGVEWNVSWLPSQRLKLEANLGLLQARYDRYVTATGDDLSGREQPQAPSYSARLALAWQATARLGVDLEFTSADRYFFSDRHAVQSTRRDLINTTLRYQASDSVALSLWGRNLTDEDYTVRGFGSFGNDPRKGYVTEPYVQFGEPRVVGATLNLTF